MEATQDILLGKWHEVRGQVRQKWGKLTDDDLTRLSGKAQAENEINSWLDNRDQQA